MSFSVEGQGWNGTRRPQVDQMDDQRTHPVRGHHVAIARISYRDNHIAAGASDFPTLSKCAPLADLQRAPRQHIMVYLLVSRGNYGKSSTPVPRTPVRPNARRCHPRSQFHRLSIVDDGKCAKRGSTVGSFEGFPGNEHSV